MEKQQVFYIDTAGYGNRTPQEWRQLLVDAGVEFVLDVRRLGSRARISSFIPGKRMQATVAPIVYKQAWVFGNHFQNLDTYAIKITSPEMESAIEAAAWFAKESRLCFICAEKRAIVDGIINCHRVHVAKAVKKYLEDSTDQQWEVKHL